MRPPAGPLMVCLLALLAACETKREPAPAARLVEPRQQGTPVAATPTIEDRPMAHRRETQGVLDSARLLLARRDTLAVRGMLHRAAAFLDTLAGAPPSGGTGDLRAVAGALDSLGDHLREHPAAAPRRLALLSARANLAEAERHATLAAEDAAQHHPRFVTDELMMITDHVERAAHDARLPISPPMRRVLADLRMLERDLPVREVDGDRLGEALAALHMEVRAMQGMLAGGRMPEGTAR